MNRKLIVNADDFNLTPGSAHAILDAHRRGIVSSTSVFTNFNCFNGEFNELRKLKTIGIGLHLNVTLDHPLAQPKFVSSLVQPNGLFRKFSDILKSRINAEHLLTEYELQLFNFRALFSRNPDHLNTHHHLHSDARFCKAVWLLAEKYQIPVRRSAVLSPLTSKVRTSNYFFGSLSRENHWTHKSLLNILENLPEGTSEIMCHPAYVDQSLKRVSSFSDERGSEYKLFSSPQFRQLLKSKGIILQSKF